MGYTIGDYPPGVKDDLTRHLAVNEAMVRAHRLAVEALRSGPGSFPVGLTLSMAEIVAEEGGEVARDMAEEILEDTFLRATEGDDFVGVQSYTRMHFGPEGLAPDDPSVPQTQMGTENWPQAVEHTASGGPPRSPGCPWWSPRAGSPPRTMPSGSPTSTKRCAGSTPASTTGSTSVGYFVWSLLDNFEWNHRLRTQARASIGRPDHLRAQPKPSARWFGRVARGNRLAEGN